MYLASGAPDSLGRQLTRDLAERIARNWWVLLVNGLTLIVAGVLIFSIHWSLRSLSIFIGALFILQGISTALVRGLDRSAGTTNVVAGLLSIAAGVAIIVWPHPGVTAVAIFLGSWLIVMGTLTISAAFAGRHLIPGWWMWLIVGLLEVPLGVIALRHPGATLAAFITVAGIWAVAVGASHIVMAFEIKRLPHQIDEMQTTPQSDGYEEGKSRTGEQVHHKAA
ncbi:MAG TPA: DUF308 domain-containing protein [Solirubrobacteraceae bacterium]|nr:DUF308 domain-containing protein [Solirubrobacteraceae bacterium]